MMMVNKKKIEFQNEELNRYSSYSILTQYYIYKHVVIILLYRFAIRSNSRLMCDIQHLYININLFIYCVYIYSSKKNNDNDMNYFVTINLILQDGNSIIGQV